MVIHAIVSKVHVDEYEYGSITGFTRFLQLAIAAAINFEPSMLPVKVANLEMIEDQGKAHWHIIFYTHPDAQEKLRDFVSTKVGAAAYIASVVKSKMAVYKGIPLNEAKKIQGVSIVKPEVKRYSCIDYAIKGGVVNFNVFGFMEDPNSTFDIWMSKTISEFYRKNCSGDNPEGGVRALYPGKSKGLLTKRPVKESEFDIEAALEYFVNEGYAPTEESFRLWCYREGGLLSFNKQHFELVKALAKDKLPVDALPNPREKILKAMSQYDILWAQDVPNILANIRAKGPDSSFQHTYVLNAINVLNSDYMYGIFKWIAQYLVVDQEERESQKNKALIIEGASNAGKSAMMEILFPSKVFGTRGLTMNMKYATEGMYSRGCNLWVYREINRGLSTENMFRFQNIIDGDETLREICKAEMQSLFLARPLIAATTTDIVESFTQRTADRDDLRDRVEQLVNRLVVVRLPEPKKVNIGQNVVHTSAFLKYLIFMDALKMPKYMAFYLFWRHFFANESKYRDGFKPQPDQLADVLSVYDYTVVDEQVNNMLSPVPARPEDEDEDRISEIDLSFGALRSDRG